jgi:hypothetical protein
MSKKLYAAFVPLFAVAAFAVLPAVAQAQPHWYSCEKGHKEFKDAFCKEGSSAGPFGWVRIPVGNPVNFTLEGAPTITYHILGGEFTCSDKGKGTIENPVGGGAGTDSITEFVNTECAPSVPPCRTGDTVEITFSRGGKPLSATNKWPSTLLAGPPIRDQISEIELKIECNEAGTKTLWNVYAGTLTPKVGSSTLEFDLGSGALKDREGHAFTWTGSLDLEGPAGDRGITAKTP